MENQVGYHRVGASKERPRLWIEGAKLGASGFTPGARYDLISDEDGITLNLNADGARKVSSKKKGEKEIPILDLILSDFADIGSRVRAVFTQGMLRITLHHEEKARIRREREFLAHIASGDVTEASMFTGIGVSTHAIHTAMHDYGMTSKLAWVVDAEMKYLQVAASNNYALTDETTVIFGRAEEVEPQFYRKVDVLSFSMPCSGFSPAGKAKHGLAPEEHEGAAALFGTLTAIKSANPAVMISENVVGAMKSPAYTLLKAEIERLGYVIHERIMDADDTNSIENRRRYWFIAISTGLAEGFDFSMAHPAVHRRAVTVGEILEHDVPESVWRDNLGLLEKLKRDMDAGKGFAMQIVSDLATRVGTFGRHYNKDRSTEPRRQRADGKFRLFTPREHARMKSCPESLIDGVVTTTAHEGLGQSVDWRQAWICMANILDHILRRFFGRLPLCAA